MKNQPDPRIERTILNILRRYPFGLCVSEVADMGGIQRRTATKHLERLCKEGRLQEIARRQIRIFIPVDGGFIHVEGGA